MATHTAPPHEIIDPSFIFLVGSISLLVLSIFLFHEAIKLTSFILSRIAITEHRKKIDTGYEEKKARLEEEKRNAIFFKSRFSIEPKNNYIDSFARDNYDIVPESGSSWLKSVSVNMLLFVPIYLFFKGIFDNNFQLVMPEYLFREHVLNIIYNLIFNPLVTSVVILFLSLLWSSVAAYKFFTCKTLFYEISRCNVTGENTKLAALSPESATAGAIISILSVIGSLASILGIMQYTYPL